MVSGEIIEALAERLRGDTGVDKKALEKARDRKGWGPVEFARVCGVSRHSIWKLCSAKKPRVKPRVSTVLAFADALDVCPLSLVPRARRRRAS